MKKFTLIPVGLLLAGAALASSALDDLIFLKWKPVVGQKQRMEMKASTNTEIQGNAISIVATLVTEREIIKINEKTVEVSGGLKSMQLSVNDQPMDAPMDSTTRTSEVPLDGSPDFDDRDGDQGMPPRSQSAFAVRLPATGLTFGTAHDTVIPKDEKRGIPSAKQRITVIKEEKIGTVDCWQIDVVYAEDGSDKPVTAIAKLWLAKDSGEWIKLVGDYENFQLAGVLSPSATHIELNRLP